MRKKSLAPIVCKRPEERNRLRRTRRLPDRQAVVYLPQAIRTRFGQPRHRSPNQPVEAIRIAGSTPSTISRLANPISQYVRRYLQSPHHDRIAAGQNEKDHHTNANPMAPALIVTATGIGIARDSLATIVTETVKDIRGVAPAAIAALVIIGKTSGESGTIAVPAPIVQAACPARLGSVRASRQREVIRAAPDRAWVAAPADRVAPAKGPSSRKSQRWRNPNSQRRHDPEKRNSHHRPRLCQRLSRSLRSKRATVNWLFLLNMTAFARRFRKSLTSRRRPSRRSSKTCASARRSQAGGICKPIRGRARNWRRSRNSTSRCSRCPTSAYTVRSPSSLNSNPLLSTRPSR